MIDYAKGYRVSYDVERVDPVSWHGAGRIGGITAFSATRSIEGTAPAIDGGDLDLDGDFGGEGYVRVWMTAEQGGARTRVPLGTFLAEEAGGTDGAGSTRSEVTLWSTLRPAQEREVPAGWYVPAGSDGPKEAAALLSGCLDAPVIVSDDARPPLADNVVAGNETRLSMAWALVGDGWEITTDWLGRVLVRPQPTEAVTIREADVIGRMRVTWDLADVPNTATVTDGTATATAVNDDPSSPTSTVARGRPIDLKDSGSQRREGETLDMWAQRLLREASVASEVAEHTREWVDGVGVGDLVKLPGQDGTWRVTSQVLHAGAGTTVDETAKREVTTYA